MSPRPTEAGEGWEPTSWGDEGRGEASQYLAGSRQQVQLDIGVSQAIEIHGLEALGRTRGKTAVSSQSAHSPPLFLSVSLQHGHLGVGGEEQELGLGKGREWRRESLL